MDKVRVSAMPDRRSPQNPHISRRPLVWQDYCYQALIVGYGVLATITLWYLAG